MAARDSPANRDREFWWRRRFPGRRPDELGALGGDGVLIGKLRPGRGAPSEDGQGNSQQNRRDRKSTSPSVGFFHGQSLDVYPAVASPVPGVGRIISDLPPHRPENETCSPSSQRTPPPHLFPEFQRMARGPPRVVQLEASRGAGRWMMESGRRNRQPVFPSALEARGAPPGIHSFDAIAFSYTARVSARNRSRENRVSAAARAWRPRRPRRPASSISAARASASSAG